MTWSHALSPRSIVFFRIATPALLKRISICLNLLITRSGKYQEAGEVKNPVVSNFKLTHDTKTGLLLLQMNFLGSSMVFPLEPLSDGEAITMGTGRNVGETIRIESRDG